MSDQPFPKIPEPSLPEHSLLREAGTLPQLSSGLRDRVLMNVQTQVRYGRWADRARIAGSVAAACLFVLLFWNLRGTGQQNAESIERVQDTVQHHAPPPYPSAYMSPAMDAQDAEIRAKTDPHGNPQPQGGPSNRRESVPEMRELNQMIEKLQSRQNVLCGLLPYL